MSDTPTWLTITQLLASPLLGAGGALYIRYLGDQDRIKALISWKSSFEDGYYSWPAIDIQNVCGRKVYVTHIYVVMGIFYRLRSDYSALLWENPDDVEFPYLIGSSDIICLYLDGSLIEKLARLQITFWQKIHIKTGRPRVKILVRTMGGAKIKVNAEMAIRGTERPEPAVSAWWKNVFRLPPEEGGPDV